MTTYVLAVPPSANKMYANRKKGGRFKTRAYAQWIAGELKALLAQRAKLVTGPASVAITLPMNTRGDCDNRLKPTIDLLVRAGVLKDDSKEYVRAVSITFGKVQMMHVEVGAIA